MGRGVGFAINRLQVQFSAVALLRNNLGQVAQTFLLSASKANGHDAV